MKELKKNFYCGDEVDYDDKCLEQCDRCVDASGVDYGYLPEEAAVINYKKLYEGEPLTQDVPIDAFKQGAKWQKGQYTIEEQHIERSIGELEKEYIKGFNQGSYWQQQRSYSEEDMEIAFGTMSTNWICFEEFIEQFKKK